MQELTHEIHNRRTWIREAQGSRLDVASIHFMVIIDCLPLPRAFVFLFEERMERCHGIVDTKIIKKASKSYVNTIKKNQESLLQWNSEERIETIKNSVIKKKKHVYL